MPKSVTVYCPYCCEIPPATCADCDAIDGGFPSCDEGEQFEVIFYAAGSKCGDRTFSEDTTCHQCFDCDFTDWYPSESEICKDVEYTQYRDPGALADSRCTTESRLAVGTKECRTCEICGYPEFSEDGCEDGEQGDLIIFDFGDFCNGIPIIETGECLECYDCDFGEYDGLPPEYVCLNEEYYRKRVPGENADPRCVEEYKKFIGTGRGLCSYCQWCGYHPFGIRGCDPETQQEYPFVLDRYNDCNWIPEDFNFSYPCVECIDCITTGWTPDPSEVCEGETFTQRAIFSAGSDSRCQIRRRERIGTRVCDGEPGYRVVGISTEVIGSPTCETSPNLSFYQNCYTDPGDVAFIARQQVYGDFVVDCSNEPKTEENPNGYCAENNAEGNQPWENAVYENTFIIQEAPIFKAEVNFTFEDCGIGDPDMRITVEIWDCFAPTQ